MGVGSGFCGLVCLSVWTSHDPKKGEGNKSGGTRGKLLPSQIQKGFLARPADQLAPRSLYFRCKEVHRRGSRASRRQRARTKPPQDHSLQLSGESSQSRSGKMKDKFLPKENLLVYTRDLNKERTVPRTVTTEPNTFIP